MGTTQNIEGGSFTNRQDDPLYVDIRAGLTANQNALFRWYDKDNALQYQMGMDSSGAFVFEDAAGDDIFSSLGIGNYSDTTVIKGDSDGLHTLFKSSDTASENQVFRLATRSFGGTTAHASIARIENTSTVHGMDIGRGDSGLGISPITDGRLYAASAVGAATGSGKLYWDFNGVNVGTNPTTPTSGRAFQVTTTGVAEALYVTDADGILYVPHDGGVRIGNGSNARIYRASSQTWFYSNNNLMNIYQAAAFNIILRCNDGSAGDIVFQTRGSTEVGRFDADSLTMAADRMISFTGNSSAPTGAAGDVYYDTTTNKLRCHNGTAWQDLF